MGREVKRPTPGNYPIQRGFTAWFLRHFFDLLMGLVSLSQWVTVWWLVSLPVPVVLHVVGTLGFFLINSFLVGGLHRFGGRPPRQNRLTEIYFATAFTSVMCFAFLLAAAGIAQVVALLQSIVIAAGATTVPLAGSVWSGFHAATRMGFIAIGLTFLYGYTIGQKRLRVRHLDIPVPGLPAGLDGITLAQISDVHLGQNLDPQQLRGYIEAVNQIDADLVCVTGDIVDSPRTDLDLYMPIFAGLRARHGVLAILGNHDHSSGAERVVAALHRYTDFVVLRDRQLPIRIDDATLHVIGLDDRGLDWARGLREDVVLEWLHAEVPTGAPVVLLVHRPDTFEHAARLGIPLTLSGHTHGGQIGIPWFNGRSLNPSRILTAFDRGLFRRGQAHLYTNCGLGVTSQKLRLATPREISVFHLRRP